jgi:hypothetical protein
MPLENPFPINTDEKQDSWDKLQLLQNVDPTFKATAEEYNQRTNAIQWLYENIIGVGGPLVGLPPLEAPDYANEAAMIANQSNQTSGFLQKVLDGPGALLVTYYIYKGTTNGNSTDYDQLTPDQAAVVESSFNWMVKTLKAKETSFTDYLGMQDGHIYATSDGNNIASLIFDLPYTSILETAVALSNERFYLNIYNATQNKHLIATVTGFEGSANIQYSASIEGIADGDLNVSDTIQLFLPQLKGAGDGSSETPATVKTKYESNGNTNAYTDGEKEKLSNIEENATADQDISGISENREAIQGIVFPFPFAASDEDTDLETGNDKLTFRIPFGLNLTGIRANVKTAPTGSSIIIDVNKDGASILSTKLSIDAGTKTSVEAATPPVFSSTTLADDDEITVGINQIGSTLSGTGLKLTLYGSKL